MKNFYAIFLAVSVAASTFAQSPQKMSYQAIIRNASDQLVTNYSVGMRISVLQGSATGTEVYKEIYNPNPQTNSNGLVSIEIGTGIPLTGTFATIDWSVGPYFIKTETDPTGGTSYTITGTSQLLSVPYALYANTITTNANLTGEVTSVGNSTTITNSAVISKVLTGFTSGAGTVTSTDNILQAIQKLNGNDASVHSIGESYGGGIVFYVYDNGQHGLIAATGDQSTGAVWTTSAFQFIVSNAVRDGVNGGLINTERIIIQAGEGYYAAQQCATYQGGSYADWYLPSKYELNLLYAQKAVVGGFTNNFYWSSSETSNYGAWLLGFGNGNPFSDFKSTAYYVRAIRVF